jgi:hypothetical protein
MQAFEHARRRGGRAAVAPFLVLALLAILAPPPTTGAAAGLQHAVRLPGTLAVTVTDGEATCGDAPDGVDLSGRDDSRVHEIRRPRADKTGPGLTIVLRGTDQLDEYPQAKAAYVRAAETWERTIARTPITIVVDVDYGPTYFGQAFPANILGVTDPQPLLADDDYSFIRSHLVAAASSPEESAVYAALPERSVPTDIGATRGVFAPTALLRALHFLPSEAKPSREHARLGNPPALAISSAYAYDFDPTDGVDASARDFEAVALHELGHVLGFTSLVGAQESTATFPVAVSVLDMFRFRPGVTDDEIGSAKRVLHSGGDQVFFAGGDALALSTGRQDASGGDGRQASHWKDEAITGVFLGLMHPALKPGVHETLTANDLVAFDRLGYTLAPATPGAIAALTAELAGDAVVFRGTLAGAARGATAAGVTMLDAVYRPVHTTARFAFDASGGAEFTLSVPGFDEYPAALAARLALYDANGTELGEATADFSGGDAAGPTVKRASFAGRSLKLAGSKLAGATLEVDGVATSASVTTNGAGTRLTARGTAPALGLHAGYNRVRVVAAGLRSNLLAVLVE